MANKSLVKVFNKHLIEFMDDIIRIMPNDYDIKTARTFLSTLKMANPKKILKEWHLYITIKYYDDIMKGDIGFFENKDYSKDIDNNLSNNEKKEVAEIISKIKSKVSIMNEENKKKSIKYIQNLTKITKMYFNQ